MGRAQPERRKATTGAAEHDQPQGQSGDPSPILQVAGNSAGPRVKGKVIIITGANSPLGIGRAAAYQFAHNGARAVYLCDFAGDRLEAHQAEIRKLYPRVAVHTRQFDAADEKAVKAVVDHAISAHGRLDIFFANHGIIGSMARFDVIDSDDFMSVMKTNALGVFLCAKHAASAMQRTSTDKKTPGGSIICTASVAGLRSNAGTTPYSASKATIISIVQTMAYDLTCTGVRINAICPGLVETAMTSAMYERARQKGTDSKIGQINPTGRGAISDEVARVALFLGSDESSYVNGQAWAVCGGLSAGHPYVRSKM